MSRALAISQRQARTLLRAAEAEHGIVEVKVGDVVFRLIPESLAQDPKPVDDRKDFRL
jgi:DNA-binding transcriptional regulator LsrR (DeoR family)